MLILTPTPLETAAERSFFAELAGWDTGTSVRGGVMASLPVVDGPMQRRQADAVLFVPEGIAVVRVVEVVRQSGVVTATPDGAWTIGPGAGPGDVLRLAGGGSTPLEGLMRAGMDAAVRLRQAGLEPGRVARLTVLTGDVTGILPADGNLGDGDQVALMDPRSLLLGIARASRYAGEDNPRLWTTADVRAGIEALGVAGRSPSVEELNVEGFLYSPYVLRRRELLVPMSLPSARGAAMSWSSDGVTAPAAAPSPVPAAEPPVAPAAAAEVPAAEVPAAEVPAAEVPAAGVPAAEVPAAEVPAAAVPAGAGRPGADAAPESRTQVAAPVRQVPAAAPTVAVDLGAAAPTHQPAAPAPAPAVEPTADVASPTATATAHAAAPAPAPVAAPRPAAPPTAALPTAAPVPAVDTLTLPSGSEPRTVDVRPPGPVPDAGSRAPAAGPGRGTAPAAGERRPLALLVVAGLLIALLLGVGGFLLLRDPAGDDDARTEPAAATTGPATPEPSAAPAPGDTEVLAGFRFTFRTGRVDDSCATRAYGAVADYFERGECLGLSRAIWTTETDGGWAVVSHSRVAMPDEASARALQDLADTDGSGNVSDLLREGVRVDGAPRRLSGAQYASALDGTTVTIVETAWADAGVRGGAATLDSLAEAALDLPAAELPGAPLD